MARRRCDVGTVRWSLELPSIQRRVWLGLGGNQKDALLGPSKELQVWSSLVRDNSQCLIGISANSHIIRAKTKKKKKKKERKKLISDLYLLRSLLKQKRIKRLYLAAPFLCLLHNRASLYLSLSLSLSSLSACLPLSSCLSASVSGWVSLSVAVSVSFCLSAPPQNSVQFVGPLYTEPEPLNHQQKLKIPQENCCLYIAAGCSISIASTWNLVRINSVKRKWGISSNPSTFYPKR